MFSCLSAAWNCSSVSILFSFLMLSRMLLNCSSLERVAELLAALHEQQLVDGVDHDLRRDLVERLPQLRVGRIALQIDLLARLPQRRDLALLELGLGEDLAVHLHEDLLDDLGAAPATARSARTSQRRCAERASDSWLNLCKPIFYP